MQITSQEDKLTWQLNSTDHISAFRCHGVLLYLKHCSSTMSMYNMSFKHVWQACVNITFVCDERAVQNMYTVFKSFEAVRFKNFFEKSVLYSSGLHLFDQTLHVPWVLS